MAFERIFTIGSTGDYATFGDFQTAQESFDWVGNDLIPVAELQGVTTNTTNIAGWALTDENHRLTIRPIAGKYHKMDWTTSDRAGFTDTLDALYIGIDHYNIHDIYIEKTGGTAIWQSAMQVSGSAVTSSNISNLLVEDNSATKGTAVFYRVTGSTPVINSHFRGFGRCGYNNSNRHGDYLNCIFEDCINIGSNETARYSTFINCAFINLTNSPGAIDDEYLQFCASTTATQLTLTVSPSTTDITESDFINVDFTNKTTSDYRLAAGSSLIALGSNLFATFSKDSDGHTRKEFADWDIGHDEFGAMPDAKAVLVTSPSKSAEFQLNADGSFGYLFDSGTYTKPNTDSFTYKIIDTDLTESEAATVTITINADGVAQASTTVSHTVDGDVFEWIIHGYDSAFTTGTFIDGSPWIVPAAGTAITVESFAINGATQYSSTNGALDTDYGMVVNPSADLNGASLVGLDGSQSFLPSLGGYSSKGNQALTLPINLAGGSTLALASFIYDARTAATSNQAVKNCGVLTILETAPAANSFRPSLYGTDKTIYTQTDFNLSVIPANATIAASANVKTYQEIIDVYGVPWAGETLGGDLGRAMVPQISEDLGASYSADVAVKVNDYIMSLMDGAANTGLKLDAINALIQRGIDLYGAYKSGVNWGFGAGQGLARRAPINFFGALITNTTVKADISTLRSSLVDVSLSQFQEDKQVVSVAAGAGVPIWGDSAGVTGTAIENRYWDGMMIGSAHASAKNAPYDAGSSTRNTGDPYGFIDGPTQEPGSSYFACCSVSLFMGYTLIGQLWPEFDAMIDNDDLKVFTLRVQANGLLTGGDEVAPPDPRDVSAVAGDTGTRTYYGVTWGPNPSNPGKAITNAQATTAGHPDAPTSGRYPTYSGQDAGFGFLLRDSDLLQEVWGATN